MNFFKTIGKKIALTNKSTIGNVIAGERDDDVVIKKQLDDALAAYVPTGAISNYKETITAAQMATCGSSPVLLIANPGVNKAYYIIPGSLVIKKSGGTTNGYTFSGPSGVGLSHGASYMDLYSVFDLTGNAPSSVLNKILNGVTIQQALGWVTNSNYIIPNGNNAIYFKTDDNSNPTAGDNNIVISFDYKLIDLS